MSSFYTFQKNLKNFSKKLDKYTRKCYTVYTSYTQYVDTNAEGEDYLNITISYTNEKPMYEQIEDGIKKAIYDGVLQNNELLPSVRQLAKDLNVSAITTKRAYIDLEHEGLVYTISGKGTFVRLDKLSELQKNRKEELLEKFKGTAAECKQIGILKPALGEILDDLFDK